MVADQRTRRAVLRTGRASQATSTPDARRRRGAAKRGAAKVNHHRRVRLAKFTADRVAIAAANPPRRANRSSAWPLRSTWIWRLPKPTAFTVSCPFIFRLFLPIDSCSYCGLDVQNGECHDAQFALSVLAITSPSVSLLSFRPPQFRFFKFPSKSFIVPLFQIFGFTWIYGVKCWVYFQRISASPSRGTVSSKCRSSMTQCQPFDRVDANLECLVNRKSARANACFSF